jgi:uncharacterized protein (UPF0276 family)
MCFSPDQTLVGLAYNKYVPELLISHPAAVDYIEVPYELFAHDPKVIGQLESLPIFLHCASLSIGGSVRCCESKVKDIGEWAVRTQTPWIGEHLSFITAERDEIVGHADEYAPGEPYNLGYTVSPPMNARTVDRVVNNLTHYRPRFGVPLLLENSPLYFRLPGSTMTQVEFINAICRQLDVGLLLDLAHFHITADTMGFDAAVEIEKLPLERVVEIHISGVDEQKDALWDNHASRAPESVFRLLEIVLRQSKARAITLEYNWSSAFPRSILLEELERTRNCLKHRSHL